MGRKFGTMAVVHPVDDPADPRLADFVGLNDPDLRRLREQPDSGGGGGGSGFFVAEGLLVIQQLLRSPYRLRSLLVTERGLRALDAELPSIDAPVYLAPQPIVDRICGFHFH